MNHKLCHNFNPKIQKEAKKLDQKFFLKKNGPTPASFSFIFSVFKQTLQFVH